ncbi:MAG: hypothetical protein K6C10_10635 [Prevotella sp.]|nr:hypothetical protein [Prevotella sp.]
MRKNRFIIRFLMVMLGCWLSVEQANADSIYVQQRQENRYDKRVHYYRKHWEALIPTQFVMQNAGNMGMISLGVGWDYGKRRQWETHLLFGYIPAHQTSRGKLTTTVKENFIPWSITLWPNANKPSAPLNWKQGWSFEPLTASVYVNTVYGHEFWKSQPGRYPDKYYEFMSTKFRLNVAFGQRLTLEIPYEKRKATRSISLFYEVSTCDLYLRTLLIGHSVPLKDVIGLSIGVKLQTL